MCGLPDTQKGHTDRSMDILRGVTTLDQGPKSKSTCDIHISCYENLCPLENRMGDFQSICGIMLLLFKNCWYKQAAIPECIFLSNTNKVLVL